MTLNPFTLLPSALTRRKKGGKRRANRASKNVPGKRSLSSEKKATEKELLIIQQTYDLIKWSEPMLYESNLPRIYQGRGNWR